MPVHCVKFSGLSWQVDQLFATWDDGGGGAVSQGRRAEEATWDVEKWTTREPNWGQIAITGRRSKAASSVDRALTPIWLPGRSFFWGACLMRPSVIAGKLQKGFSVGRRFTDYFRLIADLQTSRLRPINFGLSRPLRTRTAGVLRQ